MRVPELSPLVYEELVRRELQVDLGVGGDITTGAVVSEDATGRGRVVAREGGVVAGTGPAELAFTFVDPGLSCRLSACDGDRVAPGTVVLEVEGPFGTMLTAERTALNFLGHLSGIATATSRFVEAVAGTGVSVACTRKTTPGLRALEKFAVRCGGGASHRFGLDGAVLIKDNHIAAAGSVGVAVERARRFVGHTTMIELEVDTLAQLEEGLAAGVDAVLLDNMDPQTLLEAVALVGGRAVTEASGGVGLESAASVAATGIDVLSAGALTHSAPSLDVALDLELGGS